MPRRHRVAIVGTGIGARHAEGFLANEPSANNIRDLYNNRVYHLTARRSCARRSQDSPQTCSAASAWRGSSSRIRLPAASCSPVCRSKAGFTSRKR